MSTPRAFLLSLLGLAVVLVIVIPSAFLINSLTVGFAGKFALAIFLSIAVSGLLVVFCTKLGDRFDDGKY